MSLCGHSELFSGIWPIWGMTLAGRAYEPQTSGLPTVGSEFSLLPTPRVSSAKGASQAEVDAGNPKRRLEAEVLLPTPKATDGTKGGPNQRGSSGDLTLPSAVLLPTPNPMTSKRNDEDPAEWLARRNEVKDRTDTGIGIPLPVVARSLAQGTPLV